MRTLSIDIETYSSEDLARSGVYRYAEAPDFRVLLFGWRADDGPVYVTDLEAGEELPEEIIGALLDGSVVKWAFNAAFERVCLSRYLRDRGLLPAGAFLPPAAWRCSMVWCAYLGLPMSLAGAGEALGLEKQKLAEGKRLIRLFCYPGGIRREADTEKWLAFKAYNLRDVETECGIKERLARYPVPENVWEQYELDQEINDRGIRTEEKLVTGAVKLEGESREKLGAELQKLTALSNPNSVSQIRKWLKDHGTEAPDLSKKQVKELLPRADENVRQVLLLRQQLARSSVKKYQAMADTVCRDGRIRGLFQFYGASRSGRWAGRGVQLQNRPQNHMEDLKTARELVMAGEGEKLEALYDSVPDALAELIRTAFVPEEGKKFIVADFSAIEARVLAWLAGEKWRTEVFESGGDIYCASASKMFGVKVEKHGVNAHLRQKGKVAELALGYGGGVGALKAMGAVEMGVAEAELQGLVNAWRNASPHIVRLWRQVDEAVKAAVRDRKTVRTGCLEIGCRSGMLFIRLPSGRSLAYVRPRIGLNRFGGESVNYMGLGPTKKWECIESYGPKFVENIVQGIARDLLACAMLRLSRSNEQLTMNDEQLPAQAGRHIVAHVHDEVIIEAEPEDTVEAVCEEMGKTPDWAEGLQLRADGYECAFYRKE